MRTPSMDAIARLVPSILLPPQAHAARTRLYFRQRDLIRKLWPDAETMIVGSYTQALAIRGSDLDIVMWVKTQGSAPATLSWTKRLHHANLTNEIAKPGPLTVLGRYSLVPVFKYVSAVDDGEEDFTVDISWQPFDVMVRRDQYVVMQLERWPGAREALLALKAWSRSKGFDQSSQGGFGSYGLALSLIAVLNSTKEPPKTPYGIICAYLARIADPERKMFGGYLNTRTGELEKGQRSSIDDNTLLIRCPIVNRQIVGKNAKRMPEIVNGMAELLAEMEAVGPKLSLEDAGRLFAGPRPPRNLPLHPTEMLIGSMKARKIDMTREALDGVNERWEAKGRLIQAVQKPKAATMGAIVSKLATNPVNVPPATGSEELISMKDLVKHVAEKGRTKLAKKRAPKIESSADEKATPADGRVEPTGTVMANPEEKPAEEKSEVKLVEEDSVEKPQEQLGAMEGTVAEMEPVSGAQMELVEEKPEERPEKKEEETTTPPPVEEKSESSAGEKTEEQPPAAAAVGQSS